MPTTIETFEHIIRHESTQEMVPFLLALEKKDVVAVREKLKSLKKELERFVEKAPNTWGSLGTPTQFANMFLTGLAVFSRRDALSESFRPHWELNAGNWNYSSGVRECFLLITKALRPDWLGDWLQHTHDKAGRWAINYALLRVLEEEQLITYSPSLAGRAVVQALHIWGNELSEAAPIPPNAADIIADKIRTDSLLLHRDLPLLFESDNAVDGGNGARIQPVMPL
jgi:Family of unknown function (DUF6493)